MARKSKTAAPSNVIRGNFECASDRKARGRDQAEESFDPAVYLSGLSLALRPGAAEVDEVRLLGAIKEAKEILHPFVVGYSPKRFAALAFGLYISSKSPFSPLRENIEEAESARLARMLSLSPWGDANFRQAYLKRTIKDLSGAPGADLVDVGVLTSAIETTMRKLVTEGASQRQFAAKVVACYLHDLKIDDGGEDRIEKLSLR